jgi:hypothetical protein
MMANGCGCQVVVIPDGPGVRYEARDDGDYNLRAPFRLEFCPIHAAAPELLAALKRELDLSLLLPTFEQTEAIRALVSRAEAKG